MKPALVSITITLLTAPALSACTHTRPVTELASAQQDDCQTLDDCGENKSSHDATHDQVKAPPSELPMVGAYPTAINNQITS